MKHIVTLSIALVFAAPASSAYANWNESFRGVQTSYVVISNPTMPDLASELRESIKADLRAYEKMTADLFGAQAFPDRIVFNLRAGALNGAATRDGGIQIAIPTAGIASDRDIRGTFAHEVGHMISFHVDPSSRAALDNVVKARNAREKILEDVLRTSTDMPERRRAALALRPYIDARRLLVAKLESGFEEFFADLFAIFLLRDPAFLKSRDFSKLSPDIGAQPQDLSIVGHNALNPLRATIWSQRLTQFRVLPVDFCRDVVRRLMKTYVTLVEHYDRELEAGQVPTEPDLVRTMNAEAMKAIDLSPVDKAQR